MPPSKQDYEKVPHADEDRDAPEGLPGSEASDSDDEGLEYTGRPKRRSLAESERLRFDRETLGGQEEVERLLSVGSEKMRSGNKRARRGEVGRMEQGDKSETSSISGGDESPARVGEAGRKVSYRQPVLNPKASLSDWM